MQIRKSFYLIVGGKLVTAHETLEEAQTALYTFLQGTPNVTCFVCEVLPRLTGINHLEVHRLS